MSDQPDNLVLTMLRAIREEQSAQREKLDEVINRLGFLEREAATSNLRIADLSVRIDNLDRRVARIERRLELVDANGGV